MSESVKLYYLSCCLLLLSVSRNAGARENFAHRAQLRALDDGELIFEAATDQNLIFRLMGDTSMLLLNDIDVLENLKRQRKLASRPAVAQTDPISQQALKDEFRTLKGEISRLTTRLTNIRRRFTSSRMLHRDLQRLQRLTAAVTLLENNLVIDDCQSNPCMHGGTCYDSYKGYHCDCAAGWQGASCEKDVNECFDLAGTDLSVCMNNAQCINTPGSYRCVCRNGFVGAHCRLQQNVCLANQSSELCGHGTCITANSADGYVCICDQGWLWAANVTVPSASPCTRDVDECEPERNPCHDKCINLPGSFKCGACPVGYTGDGKYCRDIDECANGNNGGCSQTPRVNCINTEGSYHCGRCPLGWVGDGHTCTQAKSNSCNSEGVCHPRAQCEYISKTMVCTCPLDMFGHGFGPDGCTLDSQQQPCTGHMCQNNGTCVRSGRGTSCICQPGYTGSTCQHADACHPNPCNNNGNCRLLPDNKYQCMCAAGYTGTNCNHLRSFCGATVRLESGELQFPPNSDGSSQYQPDERCAFIIRTKPGFVLNLTFNAFDLQQSADCNADFLQLHDGASLAARLIGRFCGSNLPLGNGSILSTHEQVFFWFRSDNATQARGFNISWQSQPFACGEMLALKAGNMGVIYSPGFPGKSRTNLECRWQLYAPYGYRLVLRFYEVILGGEPGTANCSRDSLIFQDSDRTLLAICQSAQPAPLYSSSNRLRIDFHTDSSGVDSLFQLHYEVIPAVPGCGGVYTEPSGTISGYMNAKVCLYLISQPPGTQVRLTFASINLLRSTNCTLQKLDIFDGEMGPLLQRYCGQPDDSELEPLLSSGNVVLLRYEYALHGLNLNRSFELSYSRECSGVYTEPTGGFIKTPNYPYAYFEHMTCNFVIRGPSETRVQLDIQDLSLTESTADANYLDVYLARDERRRFNSSLINEHLVSTSNIARLVFHGGDNAQLGHGLLVKYEFVETECGSVFTQSTVNFNKLIHASGQTQCQWIIEAPGRKHLRIAVIFAWDALQIDVYDNSTSPKAESLTSYASDKVQIISDMTVFDEVYDLELVTIMLHSFTQCIISISYKPVNNTNACGGTFGTRFGVIKSPNWPRNYEASQDCVWVIEAPLGHQIELQVKAFSLEATSDSCTDDYLEIRNGDMALSPLIGRYCGNRIPSRIPSFGNHLFVSFHSDDYIQQAGFHLTWQAAATGCGGKLNSHVGAIHSPRSIDNSVTAVSCDWQIIVAEGSLVRVVIQRVDASLCNGQLAIFDGPTTSSRQLALNCSRNTQQLTLLSSSNRLMVRYNVLDNDEESLIFVMDYSTECNVRLDNLRGVIESPNFPESYPPNLNCSWDIRSGRNNQLYLSFSHLTVEKTSPTDCDFDYVSVQDMRDEELISVRHMCIRDTAITSEGNRLVIRFVSDLSAHDTGFRAEYKRIGCGEQLTAMGGQFESPKAPYSVDLDCDWQITAPEDKHILLNIRELHIETSQRDCTEDVLIVSSEPNATAKTSLMRSCTIDTQLQLTSTGNQLYVHFHSSKVRARKYFRASYTLVPARCGGYISSSSGLIATPDFHDGGYVSNTECVWSLEVPAGHDINLQFQQFNLTDSPNCEAAFVELKRIDVEGNEHLLEKACGTSRPLIRTALDHRLRVRFKANASSSGRFALRFEQQCGGERAAQREGYLKSRLDENCSWIIVAPQGAKVALSITNLECPPCGKPGNCTAGLRLINNDDDVELFNLCKEHPALVLLAVENLRVVATGISLLAQYSSVENSCGGEIRSVRGTLTSPNYPDTYPSDVECVWRIEAPPGNSIQLSFDALDIVSSPQCNEDFLEVRAGIGGQLLGLYCDNKLPTQPLTGRAEIWLKFRSRPDNTATGFKLRWSYAHDIVFTEQQGTVVSPATLAVQNDDQPYCWRILVPRQRVIVMQFTDYNTGLLLYDGFDDTALVIPIEASPWQFTSSSNVLYLKTENVDFDAFKLNWRTISIDEVATNATAEQSECHEVFTLGPMSHKTLTSPGYPYGYAPQLSCEWTFQLADKTQHAIVQFNKVDLEPLNQCQADYLLVESSTNLVDWRKESRLCNGSEHMPSTVHGTPNLRLTFKSDQSVNGTGFSAIVQTTCGSNLTGSVGTLLGRHILSYIRSKEACSWHIEVQPGRRIDFTIDYSGVATNISCLHYGLIYDGLDDHAPLLPRGKFCNQLGFATRTYRTSRSHAFVKYVMPKSLNNPLLDMWNLTYREFNECDDEVRLTQLASTYNISTPGYPYLPRQHADCSWIVIAPPGETITARFVDTFEMNVRYCYSENVELYDGSTMLARRLLRSCRKPSTAIKSSSNVLLVHYQSNSPEPRAGFRLNVSISSCGGSYSGPSHIISSERYPSLGGYPKPAACEYTIKVSSHSSIRLNFIDINLPYTANATAEANDRIEILDLTNTSSPLMVLYGNASAPLSFTPYTSELVLRFITVKTLNNYRGFRLEYTALHDNCFRRVSGAAGLLTITPRQQISQMTACLWYITVPKGQTVRLEFLNLNELPAEARNIKTRYRIPPRGLMVKHFSFYNDEGAQSKITEFDLSNYNGSGIIESSDSFMRIRILMPRLNSSFTLRARYSSDQSSLCPPDIGEQTSGLVALNALVTLQSYFCSVKYVVKPGETLTFLVQEYMLQDAESSRVSLVDDLAIRKLESNMTNTLISLSTRNGRMQLLQRANSKLLRFRASYRRYACGGMVKLADGVTLSDNNTLGLEPGQLECVWMLTSTNRERKAYVLSGNVSFSDSCDREYLVVYATNGATELLRLCRDKPQMNITELQTSRTKLLYHAAEHRPGISQFRLLVGRSPEGSIIMVLSLPSNPIQVDSRSYKNNIEKIWEFTTKNYGFSLQLEFLGRFFIEDSANCSNDQLQVLAHQAGLWQQVALFCGRVKPEKLHVQSSSIRVVFRTNEAITGDGFTFVVSSTCDAKLQVTPELQILKSPLLDLTYRHSGCNYDFSSDVIDRKMIVFVKNTRLSAWARSCRTKYFKAYKYVDDTEILIDSYCPDFEVSGYRLRLRYELNLGRAFEIHYRLNDCGGNFTAPFDLEALRGEEQSKYAHNMNCEWRVRAPPDHAIVLTFKTFNMEEHQNCRYDYVAVYKGEQRVSLICGNRTAAPPTIVVDSNEALIVARSDASNSHEGFLGSVFFKPNCNERLTLSKGNERLVLVRHYNASERMLCYFAGSAPDGYRLVIELKQLHLNDGNCATCNYLEVIDSNATARTSMGKFFGRAVNRTTLISSYEDALIKLDVKQPGNISFDLSLRMEKTMCGRTEYVIGQHSFATLKIIADNGSYYLGSNVQCTWSFASSVPAVLDFKWVRLPDVSQVTGKCVDYLHIRSGYYFEKYLCGNFNNTQIFMPNTSPKFYITFKSLELAVLDGFEVVVKERNDCNRNYTKLDGLIFHESYETQQATNCSNEIHVPKGYSLTLNFIMPLVMFSSPEIHPKEVNAIDLNTNRFIYQMSSNSYDSITKFTTTNAIRINSINVAAMRIFYFATPNELPVGCGGNLTETDGELTNPPYDNRNYSQCNWLISVPAGYTLQFSFESFDMGTEAYCNTDNLKFYMILPDGTEKLAKTLCGPDRQADFILGSNRIRIIATKSPNFNGIGFHFSYQPTISYDFKSIQPNEFA